MISRQQLSLTLYSRRRSNVRDTAISIAGNGEILSTPVNTGNRLSRGGQFSVRGRLGPGWRYSASAYVADTQFDRLEGTAIIRDDALEYGGNAQLEYSDGNQGARGFDQATLNLRYQGPTQNLQIRTNGLLGVDISYTHFLTDRISIVSTLSRVIGQVVVTERSAIGYQERSLTDLYGPLFRFTINYRFGRRTSSD